MQLSTNSGQRLEQGSLGVAVAIERLAGSEGGQGARTDGAEAGKSSGAERSKAGGNRGRLLWLPLTRMQDGGRMASAVGLPAAWP